jgi:hypothetical protein
MAEPLKWYDANAKDNPQFLGHLGYSRGRGQIVIHRDHLLPSFGHVWGGR